MSYDRYFKYQILPNSNYIRNEFQKSSELMKYIMCGSYDTNKYDSSLHYNISEFSNLSLNHDNIDFNHQNNESNLNSNPCLTFSHHLNSIKSFAIDVAKKRYL